MNFYKNPQSCNKARYSHILQKIVEIFKDADFNEKLQIGHFDHGDDSGVKIQLPRNNHDGRQYILIPRKVTID